MFLSVLITLSLLGPIRVDGLDFYVGYGDKDDNYVQSHRMYNEAIGIYHRAHEGKFCGGKTPGFHSLNACDRFYAFCDDLDNLNVLSCQENQVFESSESKCIDRDSQCPDFRIDQQDLCARNPNKELVSLGECGGKYGVCHLGQLYPIHCPTLETFSEFYGACVPTHENPECSQTNDHGVRHKLPIVEMLLATVCDDRAAEGDYYRFLGPCNRRYVICDPKGGYAFVLECQEGHVADGAVKGCVPASQSWGCNVDDHEAREYVKKMNSKLKSINACRHKPNAFYLDPFSECRRELMFCFQNQPSFHLCPRGYGVDSSGWCSARNQCFFDSKEVESEERPARSNFLTDFCDNMETDGKHFFGPCLDYYGRCHLGQMEIENCPQSQIFDPELNDCRVKTESDDCADKINRCALSLIDGPPIKFAIGQCESKYVGCVNGWEVTYNCERPDYVFDQEKQQCVDRITQWRCPIDNCEGTRFIPHEDCGKFYDLCVSPGEKVEAECPEGMAFDPSSPDFCESKENVASCGTKTDDPSSGSCEGDGGFLEHDDCTKFYRCAHGKKVEMNCPEGTAFDLQISVCNHKHLVARCQESSDGVYPLTFSGLWLTFKLVHREIFFGCFERNDYDMSTSIPNCFLSMLTAFFAFCLVIVFCLPRYLRKGRTRFAPCLISWLASQPLQALTLLQTIKYMSRNYDLYYGDAHDTANQILRVSYGLWIVLLYTILLVCERKQIRRMMHIVI